MAASWLICALAVVASCQAVGAETLTGAQRLELQTLQNQLSDAKRSAETKIEAASLLLTRSYPQAGLALERFLADSSNRPAQIAVAEAIARVGASDTRYLDPLMAMLTGKEPAVRAPAARALASYRNGDVIRTMLYIARGRRRDREVRQVTIEALGRVLDKTVVDALVDLLDDPDKAIGRAAADSLARLTGIRTFGQDAAQWKRWWRLNKDKDQSAWLSDLADSLARAKASLEADNARLRDRLAKAMEDLYTTTPPAGRDALLMTMLRDPLADVRLVGTQVASRRVQMHEDVPDEIRLQVQSMLADESPRVRRQVALLHANINGQQTVRLLTERLGTEESNEVRQAILMTLGQLRSPETLELVLAEVDAGDPGVSTAAAGAVRRIAEAHPLTDEQVRKAGDALMKEYQQAAQQANGDSHREALLTAMGAVGDPRLLPMLKNALKDPAATVRLAAVEGTARLGGTSAAPALAPFVGDADRGVRQAAIAALGRLGARAHLQAVITRTDPAVESDAAVRTQAWEVCVTLLQQASPVEIRAVLDALGDREDAVSRRIELMRLYVAALERNRSPERSAARRELGVALLAADSPAQAATHLGKAHELMVESGDADATSVWLEWVMALLRADDLAAIKLLAQQPDEATFTEAYGLVRTRMKQLAQQGSWPAYIAMAEAAVSQLAQRVPSDWLEEVTSQLDDARAKMLSADRQTVARLVGQCLQGDEAARQDARQQLQALSDRAVIPLVEELRKVLQAEPANPQAEKVLLELLKTVAPDLNGYDLEAARETKLEIVGRWLNA
jgi:HEAT repeat protein